MSFCLEQKCIHVWIYIPTCYIYTHIYTYYIIYIIARCLENSCPSNDFNGRFLEHSDLLGLRALRRVQTSSLRIKRRKFSANKKDDKAAKRMEKNGCKYHGCWVSTLVLSSLGFSQKTITCRKKGMFILIHQHFSVKHMHYETCITFLDGSWLVSWIAMKVWSAAWKDFHPGYRWKCKRFDIASYLYVEANWSGEFCWFTMSILFSKFQKQRQLGVVPCIYTYSIYTLNVFLEIAKTHTYAYTHTYGGFLKCWVSPNNHWFVFLQKTGSTLEVWNGG